MQHKLTRDDYALKVIKKQDIECLGLVINPQCLITVVSPLVVHLQSYFQDSDYLYCAVDYIPSVKLADVIKEYGKLREQRALFYCAEILAGLDAFHTQSIIYR